LNEIFKSKSCFFFDSSDTPKISKRLTVENLGLNSLLNNIYFNIFDQYVKKNLIEKYNKNQIKQLFLKQYIMQKLKIQ
jgi:hypothetical protein